MTIYNLIKDTSEEYADLNALLFHDRRITYREMMEKVDLYADLLYDMGLGKGKKIGLLMIGIPEVVMLLLSCSKLGATAVIISPDANEDDYNDVIERNQISIMFCNDFFLPIVAGRCSTPNIQNIFVVSTDQTGIKKYGLLFMKNILGKKLHVKTMADFEKRIPKYSCQASEDMLSVFTRTLTTGSTSKPKWIELEEQSYYALYKQLLDDGIEWKPGMVSLCMTPAFVATGTSFTSLIPLALGVAVIFDANINPSISFKTNLEKYKPDIVCTTRSVWRVFADNLYGKCDMSSLRYAYSIGEILSPKDYDYINNFIEKNGSKARLVNQYGMSELNSIVTRATAERKILYSAGRIAQNNQIMIRNLDTGAKCVSGERGRIYILSPAVMKGYADGSVENDNFFHIDEKGNRWANTGDCGMLTDDDELIVYGRLNSTFEIDGKLFFPYEIEQAILQDNDVLECKAIKNHHFPEKIFLHTVTKTLKSGKRYTKSEKKQLIDRLYVMIDRFSDGLSDRCVIKLRGSLPLIHFSKIDLQALKNEK